MSRIENVLDDIYSGPPQSRIENILNGTFNGNPLSRIEYKLLNGNFSGGGNSGGGR